MITKPPFFSERRQALLLLDSSLPVVPGVASRLAAFVVDIFSIAVACMFSTYAITWTAELFRLGTLPIGHRVVSVGTRVAVVLIITLYLPLCWTLTGQSIGKLVFGLRVVRARPGAASSRLGLGRATLRFIGYWLSALPFGMGFVCAAFDRQGRALHDRLAGTRVVYQPHSHRPI